MKKILNRFKEPSTWAGLSVLAVVFGVPAATADAVANVATAMIGMGDAGVTGASVSSSLTALAALVAVVLPEKVRG
jgi:hypothetical protein